MSKVLAIILGAGKSTRFKGPKHKLLTKVDGTEIINKVVKSVIGFTNNVIVVVGFQKDKIQATVESRFPNQCNFYTQEEQVGTGNALISTRTEWANHPQIMVINGDLPLITTNQLEKLNQAHLADNNDVTILSSMAPDPKDYGRIMYTNEKLMITEEKNCSEEERANRMVNAGVYLFSSKFLQSEFDNFLKLKSNGETNITDLVNLASNEGYKVGHKPVMFKEIQGVNTLEQLEKVLSDDPMLE